LDYQEPNLDTDQQKQAAAVAAVEALPADSKQQLVTNVVQGLETAQQKQVATAAVNALPQTDQEEVAATILGTPDRKTQQILWYVVVAMMGGAIFVFGILTFVLTLSGKNAEGVVALATTALGGVVGLVSTSSGGTRRVR
jgi:cytochrome bd-type quinol oxidase subunit 1